MAHREYTRGPFGTGRRSLIIRVYKARDFTTHRPSAPCGPSKRPRPAGIMTPLRPCPAGPPRHSRAAPMNLPRFHCPFPLAAHLRVELPEALAHHAVRVLRLRDGASIIVFDGQGGCYPATLEIENRRAWAHTGAHELTDIELPVRTVLVQGIASADKMDWITEKAVEMGVAQLVPITARRSVVQLSPERREKRVQHWQRIAVAASEQCGRNRIMEVAPPQSLAEWLRGEAEPGMLRLTCHPHAESTLAEAVQAHAGAL